MQALILHFEDGRKTRFRAPLPITIGRAADCDLQVRSWRVARRHAVLLRHAAGVFIDDQGSLSGTFVNGHRVSQYGPLGAGDEIIIGPCLIRLEASDGQDPAHTDAGAPPSALSLPAALDNGAIVIGRPSPHGAHSSQGCEQSASIPPRTADRPDGLLRASSDRDDGLMRGSPDRPDGLLCGSSDRPDGLLPGSPDRHDGMLCGSSDAEPMAAATWVSGCPESRSPGAEPMQADRQSGSPRPRRLPGAQRTLPAASVGPAVDGEAMPLDADHWRRERSLHGRRLHTALLEALDLRRRDIAGLTDEALRIEAQEILGGIIAVDTQIPDGMDRDELLRHVVDEAVGLGPLESLLANAEVTEIMVNRHDEIYVETQGRLRRHEGCFSSEQAVLGVIERIVSPLGRRIDESSPMVDARLHDGSRVNAIIPPVALRGASITIRKFPARRLDMDDLLRVGALDTSMARFLAACVAQRKNVVVSGGTGSGKTTLLNILSNCIPAGERVITIEDAAELQLAHAHLVTLEARPANAEGRGAVSIRDLVRNALRMRPDRIVVGECRGAEAFDMLAAMNTGHEGSLTTLHANSPRDALSRLETMILMAGMDLPLAAVREHVASSIDIVVQQARMPDGRRLLTSITQITGQESGRIQMQELFRFRAGPTPVFEGCGLFPEGFSVQAAGMDMDDFSQRTEARATMSAF